MIGTTLIVSLLVSAKAAERIEDGGYKKHLSKEIPVPGTCGEIKEAYKKFDCCGDKSKQTGLQFIPIGDRSKQLYGPEHNKNVCEGQKQWLSTQTDNAFKNKNCTLNDVVEALEQSGTNVTKGYTGKRATSAKPLTTSLFQAGLCPVNVHWHLGTEHLSVGEYDDEGKGPDGFTVAHSGDDGSRRLADTARLGHRCHHYDDTKKEFTTEYNWMHCVDMHVGETYEVHWPHSSAGACGTPNQYQTPFYDGVFCSQAVVNLVLEGKATTYENVGVQAQIFTIVNDEAYYYPDLFRGMIVDGKFGEDMSYYTGSTTGTSRDNELCSWYTPITWQVDRKCHLISASSFDKMCADMRNQRDDMTGDTYPHGSRIVVTDELAANNHVDR